MSTTADETLTIKCDCCGMSSIHLHGGSLAGLEAVATQSGWTSCFGLWACVLCSQTGRTPPGLADVRVRLAE